MDRDRPHELQAQLKDGTVVAYDLASSDRNAYRDQETKLVFLGRGHLYAFNGILQPPTPDIMYYWRWK